MSSFGSPSPFFIAGKKGYEVERSLRFNDDDSTQLTRTPSSNGNLYTYTISAWVKRGNLDSSGHKTIIGVGTGSAIATTYFGFYQDKMIATFNDGTAFIASTDVFRDTSAWYHLVWKIDGTQATASNRTKMYVNNREITSFSNSTYQAQNYGYQFNGTNAHYIGCRYRTSLDSFFDGYIAEFNFIDGQAYDPSYFGETNAITGQWNPKEYIGSYGTNGFYLNFLDNSGTSSTTLGKDSSGNGNNFTPNNFSVTAGVTNDSFEDTPTNNFATMNPLNRGADNPTCSNGNLYFGGSSDHSIVATFAIPSSGKWYWEYTKTSGTFLMSGIIGNPESNSISNFLGSQTTAYTVYASNGQKYNAGSAGTYMATPSTSTTIMIAFDADTRKLYFGADGNWGDGSGNTNQTFANAAVAYTVTDGITYYPAGSFNSGSAFANFGQRAFSYKPTGYKSLCSANLPNPTIKLPNKHFDTILYTGNGAASGHQITGLNFQPDWVWIKNRGQAYDHMLFDAVRGSGKAIEANDTTIEAAGSLQESFDSNGFTVGAGNTSNRTNYNGNTYVSWNWDAGETDGKTYTVKVVSDSGNKYRFDDFGTSAVTLELAEGGTYIFDQSDSSNAGHPLRFYTAADKSGGEYTTGVTTAGTAGSSGAYTQIVVAASAPTLYYQCSVHAGMGGQANTNTTLGSSNFDGTIQSVVKASPTSGFSIVSYEGNNVQGATVGHGLGVAPSVVIVKNRESTYNWAVWHQDLTSAAYITNLNTTTAQGSVAGVFNSTLPTSTVFSLGGGSQGSRFFSNEPNVDFIAYCFSEVSSYSKFGSYVGNGSTDGVYVHLGFRPALVITKQINGAGSWFLFDNKRSGYNETDPYLLANVANVEATDLGWDLLSNGFKLRNSYAACNGSGNTFIYLAFAESPFKNARAR